MTKIFTKQEIIKVVPELDLISEIEKGFTYFSDGQVNVPQRGELFFDEPPGEVRINYGNILQDEYYVIKIASGFPNNASLGLSSTNGVVLVFHSSNGQLLSVLLDEGILTAISTAVAGAVVAKYLAPKRITKIGIIGTGLQARLQLEYLEKVTNCKEVLVWGRNSSKAQQYAAEMSKKGFNVEVVKTTADIGQNANFIITATSAIEPVLLDKHIRKGTHITAVGSNDTEKNELEPVTVARADLVVTDSLEQSRNSGEIFQTWINGLISDDDVLELGSVIKDKSFQRASESQITVADLTGMAVQDIQIAKAVYKHLSS